MTQEGAGQAGDKTGAESGQSQPDPWEEFDKRSKKAFREALEEFLAEDAGDAGNDRGTAGSGGTGTAGGDTAGTGSKRAGSEQQPEVVSQKKAGARNTSVLDLLLGKID